MGDALKSTAYPLQPARVTVCPSRIWENRVPRYFFDFEDNGRLAVDEEGSDLDSIEQARSEAAGFLPAIAKDELPDGEDRVFVTTVRDEAGHALYRATLTYRGEWLTPQ